MDALEYVMRSDATHVVVWLVGFVCAIVVGAALASVVRRD